MDLSQYVFYIILIIVVNIFGHLLVDTLSNNKFVYDLFYTSSNGMSYLHYMTHILLTGITVIIISKTNDEI